MAHFRPVGHVQTFDLVASLHARLAMFDDITLRQDLPGSAHGSTRTIYLCGPENPTPERWFEDVRHIDYPALAALPQAVGVLQNIFNILVATDGIQRAPFFSKAMIVELAPGAAVDWHRDEGPYADAHDRYHLPLVTNPWSFLYSGVEQAHVPVGLLTWFDNHVLHSAVNFGQTPRIHLIVDVRKPAAG